MQRTASRIVDERDRQGRVRLRYRRRRPPPTQDHLRHDGRPRGGSTTSSFDRSNVILGARRPRVRARRATTWSTAMLNAGQELTQLMERPRLGTAVSNPTDDLTSALVTANVDGEQLTRAGAGVVLHLARSGRQRDDPQRDQPRAAAPHRPPGPAGALDWRTSTHVAPTAVEEIVRGRRRRSSTCAALPPRTRRSASQRLHEGDKLLLFYWSANRDEAVFKDPYRFDVRREPNPHLGFGGPGAPLLPGRPPGPPGDDGDVPRVARTRARHPHDRASRSDSCRTSSTASNTCPAR